MFDADITHILIDDFLPTNGGPPSDLLNFASTSRSFRESSLPHLFSDVCWLHKPKADKESCLHFFPEGLWPYIRYASLSSFLSLQCHHFFRHFRLDWFDEWTEPTRLKWGIIDKDGNYVPDLVKLSSAIEKMPELSNVTLSCPFVVPRSFFQLLGPIPECHHLHRYAAYRHNVHLPSQAQADLYSTRWADTPHRGWTNGLKVY